VVKSRDLAVHQGDDDVRSISRKKARGEIEPSLVRAPSYVPASLRT
jgi:hypothetical protein